MESRDPLEDIFQEACEGIKKFNLKQEVQLEVYSLFKQAKLGDCNTSAPSKFFSPVEYKKWEAWSRVKGLSSEEAKKKYIEIFLNLLGEEEINPEKLKGSSSSLGLKVSKFVGKDIETNKEFLSLSKEKAEKLNLLFKKIEEDNLEKLEEMLNAEILQEKNSAGVMALHYAIDKENESAAEKIINYISQNKIDLINQQDQTGLTPLHYAVLMESENIIRILIENGANPLIVDENGESAIDIASEEQKKLIGK